MLWRSLLVLVLLCRAEAGEEINRLMDRVLQDGQEEVRRLVVDELSLVPDVDRTWSRHLWPFKIGGSLRCAGGKVDHVGPFKRVADVTATWDWSVVGFQTTLLFEEMRLSYRTCEISLGILKTSDPLSVRLTGVRVQLEMSLSRRRGRCVNYLERLSAVDFASLEADMGPGLLAYLKEAVLERYVARNRATLLARLNQRLENVSAETGSLDWVCQQVFRTSA